MTDRRPMRRSRGGVVLVAVLVFLVIASSLLFGRLKLAIERRRIAERQELALQADWLVESAASRGLARLAADPKWSGDRWEIAAESLYGEGAAGDETRVAADTDAKGGRRPRLSITVNYPVGAPSSVTRAKEFSIHLPSAGTE